MKTQEKVTLLSAIAEWKLFVDALGYRLLLNTCNWRTSMAKQLKILKCAKCEKQDKTSKNCRYCLIVLCGECRKKYPKCSEHK